MRYRQMLERIRNGENGETKPDGYYLLRILNWLDINDIQSLTEWLK